MRDSVVVATKIRKADENLRKENLEQKRFKMCRREALLFHLETPATFKSPPKSGGESTISAETSSWAAPGR
jgi:hypothetical protein